MRPDERFDVPVAPRRRVNPWLLRAALFIVSTGFALGAIEVALRVQAAIQPRDRLEDLAAERTFVTPRGETRLGHIIRPSRHAGVLYELIPNVSTVFRRQGLTVNADGFRGSRHALAKPAKTVRILGLGDSVMFGWGVGDEQTYLSLLEKRLQARYPEVGWEIVNTAVPGYNAAMEAAVLEARGLAYHPDIVIVGYVPNDLALPSFVLEEQDTWKSSTSYLARFLREGWGAIRESQTAKLQPCRIDFSSRHDRQLVPERYRYMVGLEGYRSAMTQMDELSKRHGFELLVLSHIDHTSHGEEVRRVNADLGIPFVSGEDRVQQYMQQHGIQERIGSELTVSAQDPHPSAVWHELLCDQLLDSLEQQGVIQHRIAQVQSGNPELADSGASDEHRLTNRAMGPLER